jgi:hypothetical protein
MTNNTIYLKSGDAFILIREDSVEIVQPDGNSCITKRIEENKSLVEFFKRTPEELEGIAENYEKSRPTVNNMIPQFNLPLNTMTPKRKEGISTSPPAFKFHTLGNDELAEAVTLELGKKVIRIDEE